MKRSTGTRQWSPSLSTTNKRSSWSQKLLVIAASVLVVLLLTSGTFPSLSLLRGTSISGSTTTMSGKAFSLLVTLQFQDVSTRDEFLADIQPLVEYIRAHEPMTIGYEILLSDKEDLRLLILERYQDKEVAYLQVHKSSAEFLAFRPKLQAMQSAGRVTVSGQSFNDSGLGFVGRS